MRDLCGWPVAVGMDVVWLLVGSAAHAAPGGTLYVFGDSLLDLKNVFPIEYSNGYGACGNGKGSQTLPNHASYSLNLCK